MAVTESELRCIIREELQKELIIQEGLKEFALLAIGSIPGFELADLAAAASYANQGKPILAGLAIVSAIPVIGDAVGKGGMIATKLGKGADAIRKAKTVLKANETEITEWMKKLKANKHLKKVISDKTLENIEDALKAFMGSPDKPAAPEGAEAPPTAAPAPTAT